MDAVCMARLRRKRPPRDASWIWAQKALELDELLGQFIATPLIKKLDAATKPEIAH
jgi:hypothetical protein